MTFFLLTCIYLVLTKDNYLEINYFRKMKMIENDFFSSHNQGVTGSSPVGPTKSKALIQYLNMCFFIKLNSNDWLLYHS